MPRSLSVISLADYFGPWIDHADATPARKANATKLLAAVAKLESLAVADGVKFPVNPSTKSGVSGQTFGGFRPQCCTQGAANSSHKEGLAVDRYDPIGAIDEWCSKNLDKLAACGIYIEHWSATPHWSHWTIRAPRSGRRAFFP
jgi:hypothetical protein